MLRKTFAAVIERADGTLDSIPLDFTPDLVQESGDLLLVSGSRDGLAQDLYAILLDYKGDNVWVRLDGLTLEEALPLFAEVP